MLFFHFSFFSNIILDVIHIFSFLVSFFLFYKNVTILLHFPFVSFYPNWVFAFFLTSLSNFSRFCYSCISKTLQLCFLPCFMFPVFCFFILFHILSFYVETVDNFVNNLIYSHFFHKLFTFLFSCYNVLTFLLFFTLFMCTLFWSFL